MLGAHEAAVGRPAIAREYARELLAENRGGIPKPAAGPNRVDRGVGGGGRRRAGTNMHQGPAGHADAEAIAEQGHDVRERWAEPLMQDDDQGRHFGAELHRRRAERIRGL